MIWLTWRQARTQTWIVVSAVAALATAMLLTGPQLVHLYAVEGVADCTTTCAEATQAFLAQVPRAAEIIYVLALGLCYLIPPVVGVFWGAPLIAREYEAGTHRLVWNQSITRNRWLAVKLAAIGLAAVVCTTLLSLGVTWWASPLDHANADRLTPLIYGARGIVPIGYAAFAFALGVTAGAIVRRTMPAMAVTLALVSAVLFATPLWIRPHLIEPVHTTITLDAAAVRSVMIGNEDFMRVEGNANLPGAWILVNQSLTEAGQEFTGPPPAACQSASFQDCTVAIAALRLHQQVTYQPASRFWALQRNETSLFVALAAALTLLCFWRIRRKS